MYIWTAGVLSIHLYLARRKPARSPSTSWTGRDSLNLISHTVIRPPCNC